MKRYIVLICMLIGLGFSQQNRLFWDGGDWKHVEKKANHQPEVVYQVKAAYVNGVMDGRLYDYLKTWNVDQDIADSLYNEISDYMSTRELVKALDYFYEDAYNLTIPLPSAIVIATMYAEQMPLNTIDHYIKQSRFWINRLTLDMQNRDPSDLYDSKLEKHYKKLRKN